MRCWRTSDGRLLAEERAGVYHVLTRDGLLDRTFQDGSCSEGEHLMSTTYSIEGAELRSRFVDDNTDMAAAPSTVKIEVELSGLIPEEEPRIEELVRTALAVRAVRVQAAAEKDAEKLAAFERGLPEFEGEKRLDFVFTYDRSGAILVWGPGAVEVWREPDYRSHGRYRFAQFADILRRRYGRRLRTFTPDLPDVRSAMAFNPE